MYKKKKKRKTLVKDNSAIYNVEKSSKSINNFMKKLTKQEIERQDFVDNQIFELMQKLLPSPNMINWDIETIGSIRETIREQLVEMKKIVNEKQFYPYLKT